MDLLAGRSIDAYSVCSLVSFTVWELRTHNSCSCKSQKAKAAQSDHAA